MNRFKNHLIAAAVLSVLAVIGTIMNSRQAAAQQGPPGGMAVSIVNPLPVPVTGSTTVSGAVAATQSGAWNVNINGTPSVNVTNTPTTAVPTVVAPAASQIYNSGCNVGWSVDLATCSFAPVPAGQTLFIETTTIFSQSSPGADPFEANIASSVPGTVYIPMVQQASTNSDNFVGVLAGRMAVSAQATPGCTVHLSKPSTIGSVTCTVNGYLAPAQ